MIKTFCRRDTCVPSPVLELGNKQSDQNLVRGSKHQLTAAKATSTSLPPLMTAIFGGCPLSHRISLASPGTLTGYRTGVGSPNTPHCSLMFWCLLLSKQVKRSGPGADAGGWRPAVRSGDCGALHQVGAEIIMDRILDDECISCRETMLCCNKHPRNAG